MGWSVLLGTTDKSELLRSKLNGGDNHENRSDRRHWTHRVKARYQVARAWARGDCRISKFRRQLSYRRATTRMAERRIGLRFRIKCSRAGGSGGCEHAIDTTTT